MIVTQPAILITRFMFNLRSLDDSNISELNTDSQHFSRFSIPNFRVPSALIGDIGQPLRHGHSQSEEVHSEASQDLQAMSVDHASVTDEEHEESTRTKILGDAEVRL